MTRLRIFVGAATLVLAVSGAFFSNAETVPKKAVNKLVDMTLYRPADCAPFACGRSGTIACDGYFTVPTVGKILCNTSSVNSLVHQ